MLLVGGIRGRLARYGRWRAPRASGKEVMRVERTRVLMLLAAVALLLRFPSGVAELHLATWIVCNHSSGLMDVFQTAIRGTHESRALVPDRRGSGAIRGYWRTTSS